MKPYNQIIVGNKKIRTFSENVDELDLVWHRDKEDRTVVLISGNNWKLQNDNCLPETLEKGKIYKIPKLTFHRLIKGTGNLIIMIFEDNFA